MHNPGFACGSSNVAMFLQPDFSSISAALFIMSLRIASSFDFHSASTSSNGNPHLSFLSLLNVTLLFGSGNCSPQPPIQKPQSPGSVNCSFNDSPIPSSSLTLPR